MCVGRNFHSSSIHLPPVGVVECVKGRMEREVRESCRMVVPSPCHRSLWWWHGVAGGVVVVAVSLFPTASPVVRENKNVVCVGRQESMFIN